MEKLYPREKTVIAEMTRFARRFGRWGTIREIGESLAKREKKERLNVASTFRALAARGIICKDGSNYSLKGYRVKIQAKVVKC